MDVHFAPFQLRPDIAPGGGPVRRLTAPDSPPSPVEARGERLGISFRRGRTRTSYSYPALEAAEFAIEYGDPWRFHRGMFKAYFDDLLDIEDIETVVRVGAEAGLDATSLKQALDEGRFRARVQEGIDWSRAVGVTAIPTFIFDEKYGVVGAQELPVLRQVLQELGHQPCAPLTE